MEENEKKLEKGFLISLTSVLVSSALLFVFLLRNVFIESIRTLDFSNRFEVLLVLTLVALLIFSLRFLYLYYLKINNKEKNTVIISIITILLIVISLATLIVFFFRDFFIEDSLVLDFMEKYNFSIPIISIFIIAVSILFLSFYLNMFIKEEDEPKKSFTPIFYEE